MSRGQPIASSFRLPRKKRLIGNARARVVFVVRANITDVFFVVVVGCSKNIRARDCGLLSTAKLCLLFVCTSPCVLLRPSPPSYVALTPRKVMRREREGTVAVGKDYAQRPASYKGSLALKV